VIWEDHFSPVLLAGATKDGGFMKPRSLVLVLAAVLLALFWVVAASASASSSKPPTHETLPPFEAPGTIDCGTFEDNFVDFFTGTLTTSYDRNGSAVRLVFHIEHHSNDVNSATGLTIHEHGRFTQTIDLHTGSATLSGNQEVANRPGFGGVVQDVGRVVFDADGNLVFFAGGTNHSELFGGDQVLCDALA
jgi:hypothetical protein